MLALAERRRIVLGARNSNDARMLAWQTDAQKRQTLTWQTDADTADKCCETVGLWECATQPCAAPRCALHCAAQRFSTTLNGTVNRNRAQPQNAMMTKQQINETNKPDPPSNNGRGFHFANTK